MKTLMHCLCLLIGIALPLQADEANPLAGQIWDVSNEQFVAFGTMLEGIQSKAYILIGERHGRAAHQGREAFVIGALAEAGRYPTIAFEMLSEAQDSIVSGYRRDNPEYALGLAVPLKWYDSNWPAWSFYQPVFDVAFATKAEIVGADLNEVEQNAVATREISEAELTSPSLAYYEAQMSKAHCNLIEPERARELARIQMARDAHMAEILKAKKHHRDGIVLVVGSAHVRKNVGIPKHLPTQDTVVIALKESAQSLQTFEAAPQQVITGPLTDFDYIWFTPEIDETSLCDRIGTIE
ncbi:hypothetical protein DDZ14_02810 [Maritimibacter sp. 55A14]|uniref:ChaN family lipoprotein n=1 Tax=Maritimibacter sp. 55A14 TaxID=2174844 RepID=UPI000D622C9E|nr:ChaN family lipoprotein [Maritimibacter sp. 55A14]PWE34103.1 hypothetical protein DDZ14_02810 [Maritimibacter sp. 55A14]